MRDEGRLGSVRSSSVSGVLAALSAIVVAVVAAGLLLALAGPSLAQTSPTISFGKSLLQGVNLARPTSLQFGPDGRLYVAQVNGTVRALKIVRNGPEMERALARQNDELEEAAREGVRPGARAAS